MKRVCPSQVGPDALMDLVPCLAPMKGRVCFLDVVVKVYEARRVNCQGEISCDDVADLTRIPIDLVDKIHRYALCAKLVLTSVQGEVYQLGA